MRRGLLNIISLITFIFILVSCNKEDDLTVESYNTAYFPIEEGHFTVMAVKDTVYDDFFNPVKVTVTEYQLKVIIDSVSDLGMDNFKFVLRRFRKDSTEGQWKLTDNWLGDKNNDRVVVYEENIPYMKLAFPVRLSQNWDGNAFNTQAVELYSYSSVGKATIDQIGEQLEYAEIVQRNRLNLIERIYSKEVYAVNVGMIEKTDINLRTAVDGKIESGYKRYYKITGYGVE